MAKEVKTEFKTAMLRISSDDRDLQQSTNASNFTVYVKDSFRVQRVSQIQIKELLAPNNFYNVRDGTNGYQNNTLFLTQNGFAGGLITMSAGQYTLTEFIALLTTLINAFLQGGATVAITQEPYTKKLTFTYTGATVITDFNQSTMAEVIGITASSGDVAIFTAQALPDLSGLHMVYVHSQALAIANGIDSGAGPISLVESLSLTETPFGGYAYVRNDSAELSTIAYDRRTNLAKISVALRDKKGNRLDIGSGELTISIRISF